MTVQTFHKHEIAKEFVLTAIGLYDSDKFFSALHLAGAAEQIFHDTLCDRGIMPIRTSTAALAKQLGDSFYPENQPSLASIERVMDYPKNTVKHVEKKGQYEYEAVIRPKTEAFRMIRRSIKNSHAADVSLGRLANEFMSRNEIRETQA